MYCFMQLEQTETDGLKIWRQQDQIFMDSFVFLVWDNNINFVSCLKM